MTNETRGEEMNKKRPNGEDESTVSVHMAQSRIYSSSRTTNLHMQLPGEHMRNSPKYPRETSQIDLVMSIFF